jgi:hypothetical protein
LSSSSGLWLGLASSAADDASLAPKALGYLSVEFPVSSSSPPKVSSPAAVVEIFTAAVPKQVAVGCSSIVVPALYQSPVDVGFWMGCSSGVGLASIPFRMEGFLPPFQWVLFPPRPFSSVYGCSP